MFQMCQHKREHRAEVHDDELHFPNAPAFGAQAGHFRIHIRGLPAPARDLKGIELGPFHARAIRHGLVRAQKCAFAIAGHPVFNPCARTCRPLEGSRQ